MHWGYIAFFYLAEQMHRWQRFVFRFDKKFATIHALKHVVGVYFSAKHLIFSFLLCTNHDVWRRECTAAEGI